MTETTAVPDGRPTLDPAGKASPYPYFAYKRRTEPVGPGAVMDFSAAPEELRPPNPWSVFDYDSVFRAFRESAVFSSEIYNSTIGLVMGPTILGMTGKRHHGHRNLVAKAFRTKALARWGSDVIAPICDALVADIKRAGEADLVPSLTAEFPTQVIAELLGLPRDDYEMFRKLSFDLISLSSDIEAGFMASVELGTYFQTQIEARRSRMTDDVIGDLISAEVDGERLTDEAIISFLRLLLPAGLETTYRSSGNLLYLLLTHPDQLADLRADRSLLPQAIEEALRYETPLPTVARTTTEDVAIGGAVIPEGAFVNLCMASANRDESRWENAEQFDIHRQPRPHLAFAGGEHSCLGLHLARMETRIALNCVLDQLEDIRLIPDAGATIEGLLFRSPNKLPVTFAPVN